MNRSTLASALLAAAVLAPGLGHAAAPMATATQYGCLGCHGLEQGVVGPGFRQIAGKYKADKGAEAALMTKIRTGGAGAWGSMAMPPQPGPKDDELKAVVGWILAGAPAQ